MKNIKIGSQVKTLTGKWFEVYDIVDGVLYCRSFVYREDCCIAVSKIIEVA